MYSRCAHQRLIYPPVDSQPQNTLQFLLDYVKGRSISVLFPVGDVMTDLVAAHQDEFRHYTRFVLPEYSIFRTGRDKVLTLQAAEKALCPIPRTWYPDPQNLEQIARQCSYPVLIKPAISAGARGITLCKDSRQLVELFPQIQQRHGECFVQEFVPQSGMQYKVDAVFDFQQNLLAGVVYEKLRYYPVNGGSSVLNKTVHRPDILEEAVKVMRQMKWVGLCDFDFIADPRDGVVKLMEINPRYPESFRATCAAGIDMTKIVYELAKGLEPAAQLEYRSDRYLRFLFGDIMWFLTTGGNRFIAKPSFFSFFRRDTVYQVLKASDPGPALGYMLENIILMFDRKARIARFQRSQ